MLVPFAGLISLVTHWYDASKPFGVSVLGSLIIAYASFTMSERSSGGGIVTSWPSGRSAPSFTLQDLEGNQISLSDFRGKVVILDFWATWCPPCAKEVPHFVALHEQYKDQGFAMVGISTDRKGVSAVKSFARKHRIKSPLLIPLFSARQPPPTHKV